MKTKTFRTAITTVFDGRYVAPGTKITLPEDEANSFIDRFGEAGDGETNTIADLNSVATLNLMKALHGG